MPSAFEDRVPDRRLSSRMSMAAATPRGRFEPQLHSQGSPRRESQPRSHRGSRQELQPHQELCRGSQHESPRGSRQESQPDQQPWQESQQQQSPWDPRRESQLQVALDDTQAMFPVTVPGSASRIEGRQPDSGTQPPVQIAGDTVVAPPALRPRQTSQAPDTQSQLLAMVPVESATSLVTDGAGTARNESFVGVRVSTKDFRDVSIGVMSHSTQESQQGYRGRAPPPLAGFETRLSGPEGLMSPTGIDWRLTARRNHERAEAEHAQVQELTETLREYADESKRWKARADRVADEAFEENQYVREKAKREASQLEKDLAETREALKEANAALEALKKKHTKREAAQNKRMELLRAELKEEKEAKDDVLQAMRSASTFSVEDREGTGALVAGLHTRLAQQDATIKRLEAVVLEYQQGSPDASPSASPSFARRPLASFQELSRDSVLGRNASPSLANTSLPGTPPGNRDLLAMKTVSMDDAVPPLRVPPPRPPVQATGIPTIAELAAVTQQPARTGDITGATVTASPQQLAYGQYWAGPGGKAAAPTASAAPQPQRPRPRSTGGGNPEMALLRNLTDATVTALNDPPPKTVPLKALQNETLQDQVLQTRLEAHAPAPILSPPGVQAPVLSPHSPSRSPVRLAVSPIDYAHLIRLSTPA
eukprot:TRINITY_DN23195_c0_g1_i1.p1 TRINITY_DN23195_c0_g1~~TRINITY_DN23195_c0_g1_i1.p1  ORF type:complete len:655 (+),score=89.51 TRINITY_DN23195_c0_g1_i1:51-2015(+)